jgi:hypothetical protein
MSALQNPFDGRLLYKRVQQSSISIFIGGLVPKESLGTSLFGWCLPDDNNHKNCIVAFESYGAPVTCGCDCHSKNAKDVQEETD